VRREGTFEEDHKGKCEGRLREKESKVIFHNKIEDIKLGFLQIPIFKWLLTTNSLCHTQ
jgi:hypothetical protein